MPFGQLFTRRITIARIYGIPVRIDYRWFVVVALSIWLIASNLQSHVIQLGNVRLPPLAPRRFVVGGKHDSGRLFPGLDDPQH